MGPIAAGLTAEAIQEVADHYAALPRPTGSVSPETAVRGRAIALAGIPQQRVPACVECHGPREGPRNSRYPLLAGQPAGYLVLQLELFAERHRGGTSYAHLMHLIADNLSGEQKRDVAAYFESLGATGEPTTLAD
jgi:cytochrome c553